MGSFQFGNMFKYMRNKAQEVAPAPTPSYSGTPKQQFLQSAPADYARRKAEQTQTRANSTYNPTPVAIPNQNVDMPAPKPIQVPSTPPNTNVTMPMSKPIQAPGVNYDSQFGRIYDRQLLDRLEGKDPLVQNAQATSDTAAGRREYYARRNAQEDAVQAGFGPGTQQYSRMMDEGMSGALRANLEGQNQVNDFTRNRSSEAFSLAGQADDRRYTRGVTERSYADTQKAIAKGDALGIINSVEDPKAKNYLMSVYTGGGDVAKAASAMYENGTLREQFRSASPVQDLYSQAAEWVDLLGPGVDANGKPLTREQAIQARMREIDTTKRRPLGDAGEQADLKVIEGKLSLGQPLTAAEQDAAIKGGLIQNMAPNAIPTGANVRMWQANHPNSMVSINGQVFKVESGGSFGATGNAVDYVEIVAPDGTHYWKDDEGRWYNQKPTSLSISHPKNSEIPPPV